MNPIYKPSGRAAEYAKLACNLYTGCNNGCTYCFNKLTPWFNRESYYNPKPQLNKEEGMDDVVRNVTDHLLREGYHINNNFCNSLPFKLCATASGDDNEIHVIICSGETARYLTYSKIYNEEKTDDFIFTWVDFIIKKMIF